MNILILEDSLTFIHLFQELLKRYHIWKDASLFYCTDCFEKIDYSIDYQIIFIDLHLGKVDGIELAKVIKKRVPRSLIVFVTANESLVFDTLEIQAFYFIRKNHLKTDLDTFYHMFYSYMKDNHFVVLSNRQKVVRIKSKDIIYIESNGHYLNIVTIDNEYTMKAKISDFKKQIQDKYYFVQIHRSYIINMDYIYEVKNSYIILVNKTEMNIGKSYKKEFKRKFQEYLLNGGL